MTEVIANKRELTNCVGRRHRRLQTHLVCARRWGIDRSAETARDGFAVGTWGKRPSTLVFSPLNRPGILR